MFNTVLIKMQLREQQKHMLMTSSDVMLHFCS